jgi:hypothetical protein
MLEFSMPPLREVPKYALPLVDLRGQVLQRLCPPSRSPPSRASSHPDLPRQLATHEGHRRGFERLEAPDWPRQEASTWAISLLMERLREVDRAEGPEEQLILVRGWADRQLIPDLLQ